MGTIKINDIVYGSNNASEIIYKSQTVEEKLDTIPIFDINDNGNVDNDNSDVLTYGHIVDSLNSDATDKVLSAKQGKILNNKIDNIDFTPIENDILTLEEQIESSMENVNNQLNILNNFRNTFLNLVYPIGAIYLSLNNTDPSSLFGGVWEKIEDRFLLGSGGNYNVGDIGGAATHTLSINEMPIHDGHIDGLARPNPSLVTNGSVANAYYLNAKSAGSSNYGFVINHSNEAYPATLNAGEGVAHNNMPPYLVINIWKRIS